MDASLASYQARLATFGATTTGKTRRTSTRSKKVGAKAKTKAAWPLSSPTADQLAWAGFKWAPTSVSPDNVQCFSCNTQLDGWEESDVPAYEHLTHSPTCGFATVTCIRLRHGDPGRTEEDPASDAMQLARLDTFGDIWPLDPSAGYPDADQMAAAGWFYDPTIDAPDGVTCAYCTLALDAWDAGDDPREEHRRRSPDCLFFTLSELYSQPPPPPPKKGKHTSTRAKRTSTRSSTASSTSKKPTRGKKRTSDAIEKPESEVSQPSKRPRSSSIFSFPDGLLVGTPKKTPSGLKEDAVSTFQMSSLPVSLLVGTPKKTPTEFADIVASRFHMSSLPGDLLVGTPKKTPIELDDDAGATTFNMSSLPGDLLVGTPKKTPTMLREDAATHDNTWQPTDMELFFAVNSDARGSVNDILVDAGLDEITAAGASPQDLYAAVMAGLTDAEKAMTIEQWVLYNAKRGEEKLRMVCEQQILAFEAEGRRAMAMLESIPTY